MMNLISSVASRHSIALALLVLSQASFAQETAPDVNSLATKTGNTIGVTASGYQYKEPAPNVVINAALLGLDYTGTYAFANDWFVKADGRFAYGSAKYTGSGTQSNIPYMYWDVRGLAGYDFSFTELGGFTLAPFTGLGYRYLFDDQRGATTTGANSYQRTSAYLYVPLGVTHRMKVNDTHKLETTFEYDYLIQGTQISYLSQASASLSNVTNQQYRGYGLRLTSMYQMSNWSVGPYAYYWNIQDSNKVSQSTLVGTTRYTSTWYEPANTTVELGIKLAYTF